MAITDYIPNIFGQAAPSYIQGLLGAEETKNLQNRANVQGLLGAGLALAQGMSRVGPRRSAAENVLGALAGGFGAAGGAYDQGIKNYVTQQQIAQTQLAQQDALLKRQQTMAQQGAIETLLKSPEIANDPLKVAYIRANPNEALKIFSEQMPLQQAISGGRTTPSPVPAAAPVASTAGQVSQAPAEDVMLPPVEVVAQPSPASLLNADKNRLIDENRRIANLTSEAAQKRRKENLEQITSIDKQLDRDAASNFDFASAEKLVPPQFKGRIRSLKARAETGALSMADLSRDLADIENKSIEFVTKKTDFTNQDRRVFGGMFPNADGTPRAIETATPAELMQLENKLYDMRVSERKAGAPITNVNMPTESERTAGYLTTRLKNSLAQLQTAVGETPSAASPNFRAELVKYVTNSNYLKNLANPEARQRVEAAELDILDAALTMATGAAYTREQLESTRSTYFPTLGDKPKTVRDKANRLDQLLRDAAITKAGRSAPSLNAPAFSATDIQNAVEAELARRKAK
jgi:hypothetical protein